MPRSIQMRPRRLNDIYNFLQMSRKSRFFSWNLEGFVLQAKNNTCFACTKCNITEKKYETPRYAGKSQDRELQIRTRERNLHRKNGFIDFSFLLYLLKQPMIKLLKSFTSMKCMAWQRIYEVSFECFVAFL